MYEWCGKMRALFTMRSNSRFKTDERTPKFERGGEFDKRVVYEFMGLNGSDKPETDVNGLRIDNGVTARNSSSSGVE